MTKEFTPCDICGNKNFSPLLQVRALKRQIVRCDDCGLVLVNPPEQGYLSIDFEDEEVRKKKYDQINEMLHENFGLRDKDVLKQEEKWKRVHFQSRVGEIQKHQKSGKLLDVGCALGFFLSVVPNEHFDIYGVEPCDISANIAKTKFGGRIFHGTLKEVNLPENSFDIVTMINVIEHVASPNELLKEVHKIMRVGGVLMIETPTLDSLWPKLLKERWWNYREPEHHFFFSSQTMKKLLDANGFALIDSIKAYKLLSLRYLIFQFNRYSQKLVKIMLWALSTLGLADKLIKFPQRDEMIVFCKKK